MLKPGYGQTFYSGCHLMVTMETTVVFSLPKPNWAAVDNLLRDEQAGFRKNRSCADNIATLRIIIEQSLEWNSPLYINLIDYEKAFDSVHREAL